jgi:platelet-activating factor acetylhydrolase IB subunit alpha
MHDTYDALKQETGNAEFDPNDVKAKWVGLLEKKWTSVIRLQKKACLMEEHIPVCCMLVTDLA